MSVIYKTIFEIKILHEYYLTTREGNVIFEHAAQAQRLAFLHNEFEEGRISVNEDIRFEFHENHKAFYEGLHIKLIPSYSGCRVVARVNRITLPDQSVAYEPFVDFPAGLSIFISLIRKNSNIDGYTNQRVKRSFPGIYFFSTQNVVSSRAFPFLTSSIPIENSLTEYEQGELALSSSNTIREFYRDTVDDLWNDVAGTGFANESDRVLLPERFEYNFENSNGLTQVEFILKDSNGVEKANIQANDSNGIGDKFLLDLSGKVNNIPLSGAFQPGSFLYSLEVNGNNGSHSIHPLIFSNEFFQPKPWALVHIDATTTNDFSLFAPDGYFIPRKDPFGVLTPAPVFEIPVKSRFVYWRYINNRGRELNIPVSLADYVNKEGSVLVTKKPRSIARHWFLLEKDPQPGTVYIPNPVSFETKTGQDRRLFCDIMVPQSTLFPITI
jgi:hypothetical protein